MRAPSGRLIDGVYPSGALGSAGNMWGYAKFGPARSHTFAVAQSVDVGGGEAEWEAPAQAGIVVRPDVTDLDTGDISAATGGTTASFISYPSAPFWDSYEDFNEDLKLVGKDYSVVPEFRISEHVEDYNKFGVFNPNKFDTFEIFGSKAANGSRITSATSSFYNDYSNSEFLKDFLKVKVDSLLDAKEIKLTCNAVVRFNPYKGFYPAQRTLDLVSQFSQSYADNIKVWYRFAAATPTFQQNTDEGWPMLTQRGKLMQPILQPICSPGILYNSIKSGMAVDYPIITDHSKVLRYPFGRFPATDGTLQRPDGDNLNWMITVNNKHLQTSITDVTGYSDQSGFWDKRIPFEGIIRPEDYLMGIELSDIEPHPSCSLRATCSLSDGPVDRNYTMMAQNFLWRSRKLFLKGRDFLKT